MEAIAAAAAIGLFYSVVYPWFYQRPWGRSGCTLIPHGSLCSADCGWEAEAEQEILRTDPEVIEADIEHHERKTKADKMVQETHRQRLPVPSASRARNYTRHEGNLDEIVGGSAYRKHFSTDLDDVVVPLPRAGDRNSWMMTQEEMQQVDRISRFVGSAKEYARAVPMKVHLPHRLPLPHPPRAGQSKLARDREVVTVDTVQDGTPLRV